MENKLSIKNFRVNKKLVALAVIGSLTWTLTGCNYDLIDTKYAYNKAVILGDNCATIVNVKKWHDYDGEQIQIETSDGFCFITSSFDTKLIDDRSSEISAEDLARSIMGDDVTINYLNEPKQKTR